MAGKKTGKRLLTWVLALMMALTLLPLNVLAENVPLDEPTYEEDSLDNGFRRLCSCRYNSSFLSRTAIKYGVPFAPIILPFSQSAREFLTFLRYYGF